MRRGRAAGIEAAVLGEEADAGDAEGVDLLLLLGRDLALDPDEAGVAGEALPERGDVEIGQHPGDRFGGFVGIDDVARLAIERRGLDIGGEHLAVAVDEVRPAGGDRGVGIDAGGAGRRLHDAEHGEAADDHREGEREDADGEPDPGSACGRRAPASAGVLHVPACDPRPAVRSPKACRPA